MNKQTNEKAVAHYLADSQRNIGIYKQSLQTVQDVGINYPKQVNRFFFTQGMNLFLITVIN